MVPRSAINAVCPYYTMFPLSFPLRVIARHPLRNGWIVDPFCGRGTTNLAARLSGTATFGMDSSPIAVAIAQAKLCDTTAKQVQQAGRHILDANAEPSDIPRGNFWKRMYHEDVLRAVCMLRDALLRDCRSDARKVLRAILLGALHGPLTKTVASHLSNQCPRTYAPKPAYALRFWKDRNLRAPNVDVLEVVRIRSERFLTEGPERVKGLIRLGDSRDSVDYPDIKIGLVITSPPYYGMRTYIPDQWLRSWFLGGPPLVDYEHSTRELQHSSPQSFAGELRSVWSALAKKATKDARMAVRFGALNDRNADHIALLKESLRDSGWSLTTIAKAGDANAGKRQATQFRLRDSSPQLEHDFFAKLA
jgi:hypothetical protein